MGFPRIPQSEPLRRGQERVVGPAKGSQEPRALQGRDGGHGGMWPAVFGQSRSGLG